jgi:type VI secretion system secreted protein VgrG
VRAYHRVDMGALELSFESGDGSLSVRRFAVHEGLSSPFSISIWARSPNDDLDFEDFVGKKASCRLDGGASGRTWSGVCSTMEQVQVESTGLSTYYLRIVPLAWVLTQRRNHRLFQHQTAIEIAQKLLADWGIEPELRLDEAAYPKLEVRCQYGESDYAFLCRILEEAGVTFFFIASDDGGSKLVLSDAPQAAEARPPLRFVDEPNGASGLFATQVRITRGVRPGKVTIRDHDPRRKPDFELKAEASAETGGIEDQLEIHAFQPGSFVVEMEEEDAKKQDEKTGVAAFMKQLPEKLAGGAAAKLVKSKLPAGGGLVGGLGADIVADSAGAMAQKIASLIAAPAPKKNGNSRLAGDDKGFARYDEQAGQARAQRALEAVRATRYAVHFSTNALDVAPGTVLSLGGHPKAALAPDKRLLVTEVLLEGSPDGEWDVAASALFADAPYRPPLATPKPTMSGSQTALVVGPAGEEIHTDEFGRVRVRFHWDRESPHDDGSSCWLRVAQGWSGPGYGFVTMPRVGQEVLVGFLEGDPDQPVVVGTMFNNTSRIAHQLPGHKTRSSWKSSSSPGGEGGNEILFEDAAGKELVYLHAQNNLQEVVRGDRGAVVGKTASTLAGEKHLITVGEGVTLHEMVEQKITFTTGQASITLDGPDILIEAQGKIIVRSEGDDLVLKGGPMVKINSVASTHDGRGLVGAQPGVTAGRAIREAPAARGDSPRIEPPIARPVIGGAEPTLAEGVQRRLSPVESEALKQHLSLSTIGASSVRQPVAGASLRSGGGAGGGPWRLTQDPTWMATMTSEHAASGTDTLGRSAPSRCPRGASSGCPRGAQFQ